jgi:clan AA aspartic protease
MAASLREENSMSKQLEPRRDALGEVRVQVQLTNAIDEELHQCGQLEATLVRTYQAEALVDTGAVRCVLPSFVADQLGLRRVTRTVAQYTDGRFEEVDVAGPLLVTIMGRRTFEEALVLGDEVLIGQTALEKLDLLVDCHRQRLVPNPAHPDQPVFRV